MRKISLALYLLFIPVSAAAQGGTVIVGGQMEFPTGLGNVSQIIGPTDQPLEISTQNGQNLDLLPDTDAPVSFPVGSLQYPSICPFGNNSGLCFYWLGTVQNVIAWRDCNGGAGGGSCPTSPNAVAAGLDDEGMRVTPKGAIRFTDGNLSGMINYTNGCLTTANSTDGTLSIGNGASCETYGHDGNLNLTNLTSYGSVTVSPTGSTPGSIQLSGGTGAPTCATNDFCIFGFNSSSATAYGWQPSATAPSGTQVMLAGTPSSGVSPVTYQSVAGAGTGLTSGPTTSTSGDLVTFTGTAGQIADSGNSYATATTATWGCYGSAATTSTLAECQWTLPFGNHRSPVGLIFRDRASNL